MAEIREIVEKRDLENGVRVIRGSFKTVALEFELTPENCPTHPSFITLDRLLELQKKAMFFGLFQNNMQIGFVAIEQASDKLYYMDKLAVLPEHRHRGYGKKLVQFVLDYATVHKGDKVALGMIDESTVLKNWYAEIGFIETGTRRFEHLPFTVCFMEKSL